MQKSLLLTTIIIETLYQAFLETVHYSFIYVCMYVYIYTHTNICIYDRFGGNCSFFHVKM